MNVHTPKPHNICICLNFEHLQTESEWVRKEKMKKWFQWTIGGVWCCGGALCVYTHFKAKAIKHDTHIQLYCTCLHSFSLSVSFLRAFLFFGCFEMPTKTAEKLCVQLNTLRKMLLLLLLFFFFHYYLLLLDLLVCVAFMRGFGGD